MSYETIARHITGIWVIVNAFFSGLWKMLDEGQLVRRSAFLFMWFITIQAYWFCFEAAKAVKYDVLTMTGCFAILTPVSALQAFVSKFYNDSKILSAKEKRFQLMLDKGLIKPESIPVEPISATADVDLGGQ